MKKIIDKIANVITKKSEDSDLEQYKFPIKLFNDMTPEGLYHDYAIELEVSHESAEEATKEIPQTVKDKIYYKRESNRICEVSNIHLLKQNHIEEIYNNLYTEYKDKLPVGNDGMLSGGVHFHVFLNKENDIQNFLDDIHHDSDKICKINNTMINNFRKLPLFFKYYNDNFIGRWNMKSNFLNNNGKQTSLFGRSLGWGIKEWGRYTENKYYSIEFRFNQNIDIRLYGYYIGLYLLSLNNIELPYELKYDIKRLCNREPNIRNEAYCNNYGFQSKNNANPQYINILDNNLNIKCDDIIKELKSSYKVNKTNKQKIIKNLEIIHKALHANGLVNASTALREYQEDFNIC